MQLKHYEVEPKPIGIGYYGVVYRAYDPLEDRVLAIKKTKIEMGKKEAQILKKVNNSKFLPALYEFLINDGFSYIVMEYIEGEKLGDNFKARIEPWDVKTGIKILMNILEALENIHHRAGFIHNDVMPKNIMIKDKSPDTVKLFDLNLAKEMKNSDMFLKDLRNVAEVGMVLLNGVLPDRLTGNEIKNEGLMSVLMKGLKPTEENRYDSAKQFSKALQPFID
ncbi:protein kinase domain-containing protein [Filobacillus milosensis]|uniref:protein kinase domain-containing protein n=1 Tax=Filobacillus milosensis TaxID=94137 RepID=UPI0018912E08|nr:protein kinase [Filobacillus milosensis]